MRRRSTRWINCFAGAAESDGSRRSAIAADRQMARRPNGRGWTGRISIRLFLPWLNGDGFADKTPLGFWPLPSVDYLDNYDAASRRQYWSNASTHFNRAGLAEPFGGDAAQAFAGPGDGAGEHSAFDGRPGRFWTLIRWCAWRFCRWRMIRCSSCHRTIRLLPDPSMAGRIVSLAPGLVFGSPTQIVGRRNCAGRSIG